MGVPKLYRWLSERFPLAHRAASEQPTPLFDNLYLDWNGAIHNCTHGDEVAALSPDYLTKLFAYLDTLVDVARPQRLLYIAVDGVAPRAKMNQQRQRRFRTARSASLAKQASEEAAGAEDAEDDADDDADDEAFDSNCITPGTEFLVECAAHLATYVQHKLDTDRAWQHLEVIISGPEVPGEGEHKIMDYIRWAKAQQGYDPNTRHCLYGLDADLVLLALASHEPHFALLRERVVMKPYRRGRRALIEEAIDRETLTVQHTGEFVYWHLSLLREYLDMEFRPRQGDANPPKFPYSLERTIDDFIFLCTLIGNDFLPPLPGLEIDDPSTGGLRLLFERYREVRPRWNSYIVNVVAGEVNTPALEELLLDLAVETRVKRTVQEKEAAKAEAAKQEADAAAAAQQESTASEEATQAADKAAAEAAAAAAEDEAKAKAAAAAAAAKAKGPKPSSWAAAAASRADGGDGDGDGDGDDDEGDAADEAPADDTATMTSQLKSLLKVAPSADDVAKQLKSVAPDAKVSVQEAAEAEAAAQRAQEEINAETAGLKSLLGLQLRNEGLVTLDDWETTYYTDKFPGDVDMTRPEHRRVLAAEYMKGLHWVLHYYFRGTCSWGWFFPYHYAPLISDLRMLASMKIEHELGEPFSPFEQLLSVLPAASARFLPAALQPLMTDPASPILDFYPENYDFIADSRGREWKDVALIPFVDAERLRAAVASKSDALTPEEKKRNQRGTARSFVHDASASCAPVTQLAEHLRGFVAKSLHVRVSDKLHSLTAKEIGPRGSAAVMVFNLLRGTTTGRARPIPTFPTTYTLPYSYAPSNAGVITVGGRSRHESMILKLKAPAAIPPPGAVIGKRAYIGWPYQREAMVIGAIDSSDRFYHVNKAQQVVQSSNNGTPFAATLAKLTADSRTYGGYELGDTRILLQVVPLLRLKRIPGGAWVKQYAERRDALLIPFQTITPVMPSDTPDPRFAERVAQTPDQVFPKGAAVVVVAGDRFGTVGHVTSVDPAKGTVSVRPLAGSCIGNPQPRIAHSLVASEGERFISSGDTARMLGVSHLVLSRLTSSVTMESRITLVDPDAVAAAAQGTDTPVPADPAKETQPVVIAADEPAAVALEVGLQIKYARKGLHRSGWARQTAPSRPGGKPGWEYSKRAVEVFRAFAAEFPEVVAAVSTYAKSLTVLNLDDVLRDPVVAAMADKSPAATEEDILRGIVGRVRALATWLHDNSPQGPLLTSTTTALTSDKMQQVMDASAAWAAKLPRVSADASVITLPLDQVVCPQTTPFDPDATALRFPKSSHVNNAAGAVIGDRVVVADDAGSVPFGARGTVASANEATLSLELILDQPFLTGTRLGGRINKPHGAVLPACKVINMSSAPVMSAGAKGKRAGKPNARDQAAAKAGKTGKNVNPFDLLNDL